MRKVLLALLLLVSINTLAHDDTTILTDKECVIETVYKGRAYGRCLTGDLVGSVDVRIRPPFSDVFVSCYEVKLVCTEIDPLEDTDE